MGAKLEVTINKSRTWDAFGFLVEANNSGEWPYDVAKQPHADENLPTYLKSAGRYRRLIESRFFMSVCFYMAGPLKSDTGIKALARVIDVHPEFLTSDYAPMSEEGRTRRQEAIQEALEEAKINRKAQKIAQQWVPNFTKLDTFWRGDPRKLFAKTNDFDELRRRFINGSEFHPERPIGFYGFREKMVSMLAFFLMDRKLVPYYPIPQPTDIQVLRILTECELLQVRDYQEGDNLYTKEYLAAAREATYRYCVETGVTSMQLNDCLWMLGRTGCSAHPDNHSTYGEPNGRKTEVFPLPFEWTRDRKETYYNTCGQCPLRKHGLCTRAVPSGPYYKNGILVTRGLLTHWPLRPKQLELFDKKKK